MSTQVSTRVVRRSSLPLTERDDAFLRKFRNNAARLAALETADGESLGPSPSESALLRAIFEQGLRTISERLEEDGYAQMAHAYTAEESEYRAIRDRRRPSWADEA